MKMYNKIFYTIFLLMFFGTVYSQQVPGKEQSQSILISNGTIHVGNGDLLQNAFVGFDNGKISGTVDIYEKNTKDLLQQTPIPTSTGFSNMLINRGTLENKGVELGLDVTVLDQGDLNITVGGNIAFNKTKIENLGLIPGDILMDNGSGIYGVQQIPSYLGNTPSRGNSIKFPLNIFLEGHETALFYGWKTDGLFQEGDEFYNINGSLAPNQAYWNSCKKKLRKEIYIE